MRTIAAFVPHLLLLVLLLGHSVSALTTQLASWSYSNIAAWPGNCNSNNNQSPIAFRQASMQPSITHELHIEGNCSLTAGASAIMDLGHRHVSVGDKALNCYVIHPVSKEIFKVNRLHLHLKGEHAVGDTVEDAELHVVMSHVTNTTNKMVLGVLIKVMPQNFDALLETTLWGFSAQASGQRSTWDYGNVSIRELMPRAARQGRLLLYQGSLTTPTCDPVVSWAVFETPARVSADVIRALLTLQLNRTGEYNNRPLQNATNRKVTPVELIAPATDGPSKNLIFLLIIGAGVVAWFFMRRAGEADEAVTHAPTADPAAAVQAPPPVKELEVV